MRSYSDLPELIIFDIILRSYSDIPQEIIFDILCRVPAKSVGLCRCVSKPWRALLSQPDFIKTHLQKTKINSLESLAIISWENFKIYSSAPLNNARNLYDKITLTSLTRLSFADCNTTDHSWYTIVGSCDGLLLVCGTNFDKFVMNPVTREIKQVPYSAGYCMHGLGYDSVRDDYKMVISSYGHPWVNGRFVEVYSLKDGSWKRLESFPYDYVGKCKDPGVFVGGCLHWLDERTTDHNLAIVALDLGDEKFREVPPPCLIFDNDNDYKLDVVGGCLCVYAYKSRVGWVMKEYGVVGSWTIFMVNNCRSLFDASFVNEFKTPLNIKARFVESLVSPHATN